MEPSAGLTHTHTTHRHSQCCHLYCHKKCLPTANNKTRFIKLMCLSLLLSVFFFYWENERFERKLREYIAQGKGSGREEGDKASPPRALAVGRQWKLGLLGEWRDAWEIFNKEEYDEGERHVLFIPTLIRWVCANQIEALFVWEIKTGCLTCIEFIKFIWSKSKEDEEDRRAPVNVWDVWRGKFWPLNGTEWIAMEE